MGGQAPSSQLDSGKKHVRSLTPPTLGLSFPIYSRELCGWQRKN